MALLPNIATVEFLKVQEFYMAEHQVVVSLIRKAGILYRLEFFVYQNKFILYVPQANLEQAQTLCASVPKYSPQKSHKL